MSADLVSQIECELLRVCTQLPVGELREAMTYALLGPGKRLRPLLCLHVAALFDVSASKVLHAAAATECIHAYSLVHDDLPCMDDDDERRGRPSVHVVFGEATALLAGDALLTLAFELLAAHDTPAQVPAMVTTLARASGAAGMVLGQVLDIAGVPDPRMRGLKTGALLTAACRIGGIAGGADAAADAALTRFGTALGEAFQLRDDMLDGEAEPEAAAALDVYTAQAVSALELFGERAAPLRALAESMARREA